MTNEEKLNGLKKYLSRQRVCFIPNYNDKHGFTADMNVVEYGILVFISRGQEADTAMYKFQNGSFLLRRRYHPIFLREEDTMDFIIEKYENCKTQAIEQQSKAQAQLLKRQEGLKHHEECLQRHEEKVREREEKQRLWRERKQQMERKRVKPMQTPQITKPVVVMRSRRPKV